MDQSAGGCSAIRTSSAAPMPPMSDVRVTISSRGSASMSPSRSGPRRSRRDRIVLPRLAEDGGFQHVFAPLPGAGGGCGLRSARLGVVHTVVLGHYHVDHGLRHSLGDAPAGQSAFKASRGISSKRTGFPSAPEMIRAISLKDKSSGPSIGRLPTLLQKRSSSSFDAAEVGVLRSPGVGAENIPWFLISSTWRSTLSMNEAQVLWVAQRLGQRVG